jgi:thiol-disulfide isomerase/thioredoxin
VHHLPGDGGELPVEGQLPAFTGATGWLTADPLTPEDLRGRVVLVDFWTYTCVNWLRTLPYVRAWDAKYAAQGLTTIGVHTPEFDFEHDVANITTQARALNVPYPIAVDSDYGVWNAFANHYWPAVYLADAQGRIRYHHFGEGATNVLLDGDDVGRLAGVQRVVFDVAHVDRPGLVPPLGGEGHRRPVVRQCRGRLRRPQCQVQGQNAAARARRRGGSLCWAQRGVDADLAKSGVAPQPAHRRQGLETDLVCRVAWA